MQCKNSARILLLIYVILQESNSLLEAARISLIRGFCNNLTYEAILQLSHLRLGVCLKMAVKFQFIVI